MRDHFLLDPGIVYLNHGSFGACARPVFERYIALLREVESEPVQMLVRRFPERMAHARERLAEYVGAMPNDLVHMPNATVGVNVVARSLRLGPGDEVLATDHEYGACDRAWRFCCAKVGASFRRASVTLPPDSPESVVDQIWSHVNERTRVLFVSHITSLTALRLPVAELVRRARQAGVLSVIDGAHAPGQIELDLGKLGADIYIGNCHKWLCSPKGAGFLCARPEVQPLLEPLVVSWGWESERPGTSPFIDQQEYTGTRDYAAFLSVPAAIDFQRDHDWPEVRRRCHELASAARTALLALPGTHALYADDPRWFAQMVAVAVPRIEDAEAYQYMLYDDYRVEVPVHNWRNLTLVRVAIQGYNSEEDVTALISALEPTLPT